MPFTDISDPFIAIGDDSILWIDYLQSKGMAAVRNRLNGTFAAFLPERALLPPLPPESCLVDMLLQTSKFHGASIIHIISAIQDIVFHFL